MVNNHNKKTFFKDILGCFFGVMINETRVDERRRESNEPRGKLVVHRLLRALMR